MASNQLRSMSSKPLSMLSRITPSVYVYNPNSRKASDVSAQSSVRGSDKATVALAPKLILMAAWMDAHDAHIAKYVTRYQAIYPTSSILLVKFAWKQTLTVSGSGKIVKPAVAWLRKQIEDPSGLLSLDDPVQPEILTHIFSNGGTTTMSAIYEGFWQQTGRLFPPHVAVYDSCPGLHSFAKSYNALMLNFPRGAMQIIAAPLVTSLILSYQVWHGPFKCITGEDFMTRNSRIHNDTDSIRQTSRTYIYSKADVMVGWRDVENHAKAAAAKGFDVRTEMYENSPHVSHMRADGERYWKIFTETWEKGKI